VSRAAAPRLLAPLLFAALIAAAILSLAVVQGARRVGVMIDEYSVESTFSPNGDGHADSARIKFRARRSASGVAVRLIDGDGDVVRTLDSGITLSQRDRLYRFDWNGRTDAGELAAPGYYRAEIVIPDGDREIDSPARIQLRGGRG
jgi:flagellar hook assembly protein FlgD